MKIKQAILATSFTCSAVHAAPAPASEYSSACGGFIGTCLMELQRTTHMLGVQMKSECICRALNDHPECTKEGYICSKPEFEPQRRDSLFHYADDDALIVCTTPEGYTREGWIEARVIGTEEMLKRLIASIHGDNPTIPKEIAATIFEDGSSIEEWYRLVVREWQLIKGEEERQYFLQVKMEEKIEVLKNRLEKMSE